MVQSCAEITKEKPCGLRAYLVFLVVKTFVFKVLKLKTTRFLTFVRNGKLPSIFAVVVHFRTSEKEFNKIHSIVK
jgi:hypothetical protein